MADKYYLRRGKQLFGPISKEKIQKSMAAGQIIKSDLIATSQNGPWEPIGNTKQLINTGSQRSPDIPSNLPPANLIPCPDCGQQVSPRAVSCPKCGGPLGSLPPTSESSPVPPQSIPVPAESPGQSIEIRAESEYVAVAHGPYDLIFDLMRRAIAESGGQLKSDSASDGNLLGKWRYGINPFGLSVSAVMRDAGNGWTRVEVKGFFSDALDTFGHAKKQARQVMSQFHALVGQQSFATTPASTPPTAGRRPGPSAPSVATAGSGKSYSGMATASMICGIGGLFLFGCLLGPIAVVLGIIALNGMSSEGNDAGHGAAITGLVLGAIGFIAWSLIIAANM